MQQRLPQEGWLWSVMLPALHVYGQKAVTPEQLAAIRLTHVGFGRGVRNVPIRHFSTATLKVLRTAQVLWTLQLRVPGQIKWLRPHARARLSHQVSVLTMVPLNNTMMPDS